MDYKNLLLDHQALMTGRWLTDLANTSAFIFDQVHGLNWAGFYLYENDCLYLGPFQGKPACTEIRMNRGVCGAAATQRKTIVVADVHQFKDHITCDPVSRSEVVIPMVVKEQLIGVMDIDSPQLARFSEQDAQFFEQIAKQLLMSAPA